MRRTTLATLVLLAADAAAFAQAPAAGGPPLPKTPDQPATLLYYAVVGVLLIATVAVSVMPSKRGHLD